jgi:hypothetical protein
MAKETVLGGDSASHCAYIEVENEELSPLSRYARVFVAKIARFGLGNSDISKERNLEVHRGEKSGLFIGGKGNV